MVKQQAFNLLSSGSSPDGHTNPRIRPGQELFVGVNCAI